MVSFPVHKFLTFKSGNFVFSAKFSFDLLTPLLFESKILYQTINDLPILPRISSSLQEEFVKRSIFSTAALEGNPLSEDSVINIINNQDNYQDTDISKREIINLKKAYEFLPKTKPIEPFVCLSEQLIKDIHKLITDGIIINENFPGIYRSHIVKVGDTNHGGIYTPPKIQKDIINLSSEFIKWINSSEMKNINPIIRAALSHYHIALIHPFADGNGRTARLIEALILQSSGFKYMPVMLSNFYYKNMDEYYWTFSKSIKNKDNDITMFLEFVINGIIESLIEIKSKITYHIRIFMLKEYFLTLRNEKQLSRRQYDFMFILIENIDYLFTLNDLQKNHFFKILYQDKSPSTMRRDINRLLNLKLIKNTKEQFYQININTLD
ncbi:Fic family protein [bacterium]|nr:Fic family protein [bacterium]